MTSRTTDNHAKHTPGPWSVYWRECRPYQVLGAAGEPITAWGGISRRASLVGQANATLIAAAPELLAALTALLRGWDMLGNGGNLDADGNPPHDQGPLAIAARDAIDKATG